MLPPLRSQLQRGLVEERQPGSRVLMPRSRCGRGRRAEHGAEALVEEGGRGGREGRRGVEVDPCVGGRGRRVLLGLDAAWGAAAVVFLVVNGPHGALDVLHAHETLVQGQVVADGVLE